MGTDNSNWAWRTDCCRKCPLHRSRPAADQLSPMPLPAGATQDSTISCLTTSACQEITERIVRSREREATKQHRPRWSGQTNQRRGATGRRRSVRRVIAAPSAPPAAAAAIGRVHHGHAIGHHHWHHARVAAVEAAAAPPAAAPPPALLHARDVGALGGHLEGTAPQLRAVLQRP